MTAIRSWEKLRPWPVYLMAAFIPVSLAATNLFKLLTLVFALVAVVEIARRSLVLPALTKAWTPRVILLMLAALTLSLIYTTAPWGDALRDLGKYGKLLIIPCILLLLRSRREATVALGLYLSVQTLVVITSWLLYLNVPVFWVPAGVRNSVATVYSSYLDQSIMTAAFSALCWHLRGQFPGRYGTWLAVGLATAALANVLLMLPGRSGQVAAIAVVTMALLWGVPRQWRLPCLLAPVLLVVATMWLSPQFNARLTMVASEVNAYQVAGDSSTSSGLRLHFWRRSLQAMAERPLLGYGVGTWNQQYRRLEGATPQAETAAVRNPHQEYLLWGVQLGLFGIALLLLFKVALVRDMWRFGRHEQRAALSLVAVFAVANLFNSTLFDALIGEFFCITLGIMLAYGHFGPEEQQPEAAST